MRRLGFHFLLCSAFALLWAENGRDFAGQYAVSNVVEHNGTANATLTVRLMNYSGRDIYGARLLLLHAGSPGTVLDTNLSFANHSHKVVRAEVVIPAAQSAQWQQRGVPELVVESLDENGLLVHRRVELIRAPQIPEEK